MVGSTVKTMIEYNSKGQTDFATSNTSTSKQ